MRAMWVVRDGGGELQAAFPIEAMAIDYEHRYGNVLWTVTRETLLTPEMAAVIAAAEAWAYARPDEFVDKDYRLLDAVRALRTTTPTEDTK
jgi:hypothetical protein